ncbi:hypothetical protein SCUCBS95973_002636 [Sporothrix curviconia]|uniref:Nulp1-pending protein n=1 Tax=Sporothrix curviconia TaxID=1260050 RepID=A0ABP0B8F3_9PEZI
MSSRQLKKLRAQEELAAQQRALGKAASDGGKGDNEEEEEEEEQEEEGGDEVDTRPRPKNVFAAFAALGGEGENDEGDEDEDEDDAQDDADEPQRQEETRRAAPKASKKKKKKKKKGKGGGETGGATDAAAAAAAPAAAAATVTTAKTPAADLDEIDRALQELALKPAKPGAAAAASSLAASTPTASPSRQASKAIKINFADLRVTNELREVFGREAMQAAAAEEAQGVPGRQRPAGGGGGGGGGGGDDGEGQAGMVQMDLETFLRAPPPPPRGMVYVNANGQRQPADGGVAAAVAKRNPFIQWKETWPKGTSGGLSMRRVAAASAASAASSQDSGDEDFAFVHSPAYQHLEDTFLTLVMMHNPHPLIQFLRQHPFHIASLIQVSRVAKLQDQNASLAADLCERALFSFGRSALSSFRQALLDSSTARLSFYRPENRQFVLASYHYIVSLMGLGTYRTALAWTKLLLSVMPHDEYALLLYAQSLAVRAFEAKWLIDYLGGGDAPLALTENPMGEYVRQSLVPALLQAANTQNTQNTQRARMLLAQGLASLPWLYGALFQSLGLDVPRAVWGITPRNDTETLYTELYLHLAKDLWEGAAVRSLLQDVAGAAPKADVSTLPLPPPVNLSIARFVYLDATPGLMGLVPQAMLHAAPNYDFDPLPPPLEQNVFSNPSQKRPWIMAVSDAQHRHIPGLPDGFLMPGQLMEEFDVEDEDHVGDWDEEEEEGGEDEEEDEVVIEDEQEQHQPRDTQDTQQQARPRSTGGGGGMPGAWVDDD